MRRLALVLAALPLAACNGSNGSFSIDAKSDGDGNSTVTMDNGTVAIKGNGFQGEFRMPKIHIDTGDLDLDGLKLYPGSEIGHYHLDAQDKSGSKNDTGKVAMSFSSPAPLARVRGWYRENLVKQGFKFSDKGDGFAGTTAKGGAFTLELSADGDQKTRGKMQVSG